MHDYTSLLLAAGEQAWALYVLGLLVAAGVGAAAAWGAVQLRLRGQRAARQAEAERQLDLARQQRDELIGKAEVEAQRLYLEMKERFERETADTREEIKATERRLGKREDVLDKKLDVLSTKERKIEDGEQQIAAAKKQIAAKQTTLDELLAEQRNELLRVAKLSPDEAKALCLKHR